MRRVLGLLLIGVLAASGWFLAPTAVGGNASFVVSDATMEPNVPEGALVILRERAGYQVGDVVAYRDEPSGSVRLARLVGDEGDRFLVRGDAEVYADGYHPAQADLLGTPALTVPKIGPVVTALGPPLVAVTLSALLLLLVAAVARRHRSSESVSAGWTPRRT